MGFFSSSFLVRFQQAVGGVPAWADLENRKKSKTTLSDSKYVQYYSDKFFCDSLFILLEDNYF